MSNKIEVLRKMLEEYGFEQPIVVGEVDGEAEVLSGATRLLAAARSDEFNWVVEYDE